MSVCSCSMHPCRHKDAHHSSSAVNHNASGKEDRLSRVVPVRLAGAPPALPPLAARNSRAAPPPSAAAPPLLLKAPRNSAATAARGERPSEAAAPPAEDAPPRGVEGALFPPAPARDAAGSGVTVRLCSA